MDIREILGVGDWGVNGTNISIGKLATYTAAAWINLALVIAVNLDISADNGQLLIGPVYLGNHRVCARRVL